MLSRVPRGLVAAFCTLSIIAGLAAVASADDVTNGLDTSIDVVAEQMPLAYPGPLGTTTIRVQPRTGDGQNGCNIDQGETLWLNLASDNPSVATVSPTTISFSNNCGSPVTITVTPTGVGQATVTATVDTARTNVDRGGFNTAPATFTVNVTSAVVNQPPTLAITGVTGGASYEFGSVPAATCDVADDEDGPSSFPATLGPITGPRAADGLGTQEASCSYTDAGGLTVASSVTYSIVDTTAPVITATGATVEATGPTTPVTVSASAVDAVDGAVAVVCTPAGSFPVGSTDVTCTATDQAGNTASTTVQVVVTDTTPPTVTVPSDITVDPTGISGAVVTYSASATDLVDGTVVPSCSPASGSTFGFGTTTVTCTATDAAGNTASEDFAVTVRPLTLSGFFQPVDLSPTVNTVKNGSTVPLKFRVFAGSTELTSTAAVAGFSVTPVGCISGVEDAIEELATTGGTSLRYDTTGRQFIQNWQTPKKPGACYRVTMTTVDGSTLTASFRLK